MMKLRKNLLIAMLAGLLAFAGVACDDGAEEDTDVDVTDPAEDTDSGLEEDPLEEEPADS